MEGRRGPELDEGSLNGRLAPLPGPYSTSESIPAPRSQNLESFSCTPPRGSSKAEGTSFRLHSLSSSHRIHSFDKQQRHWNKPARHQEEKERRTCKAAVPEMGLAGKGERTLWYRSDGRAERRDSIWDL